jgi:hypothetical protein
MDLFMIRLENGGSVVLQAKDEEQALEFAGIRVDLTEVMKGFSQTSGREYDPAEFHLALVDSGTGPQHFTIRKLNNFMCTFKLDDQGNFEGTLGDGDDTNDEFWSDYPILAKMLDEVVPDDLVPGGVSRDHYDAELKSAIARERNRLVEEGLNRMTD